MKFTIAKHLLERVIFVFADTMANGKLLFMFAAVFLAVCCATTSRRVMHMFHYDKEPMESDPIPEENVGLVL